VGAEDVQVFLGRSMPAWAVIPFVALLLSIAFVPLVRHAWWERNASKALVSGLCALPVVVYLAWLGADGRAALGQGLHEYYGFIVLLFALFTISGGIRLEGDLRATPLVNTTFLGIGAVLASVIGTTGAAMLLVRPLLQTNRERRHTAHVFVFFIFLVANIGGALTPVGDPPLFIGYLYGVPFLWTAGALWPAWLTTVALLLVVFYARDVRAYATETAQDRRRDDTVLTPLRLRGGANLALLAGVPLAALVLTEYHLAIGTRVDLAWLRPLVMLALAGASLGLDRRTRARRTGRGGHVRTIRDRNHFTFAPMVEVAVLFAGIFVTMIPAICLLKAHGSETGLTHAWQFFWMSGGLSSFLDNAPTYAAYFALGQGVTHGLLATTPDLLVVATRSGPIAWHILVAISLGSVFMGANTYIGNAPNFMVKAICEQAGVKMPGFLGYMAWSAAILLPTFLLITAIFFR
jgi:Na+/H+ antiporter NhaD/arsenite permease-like protein